MILSEMYNEIDDDLSEYVREYAQNLIDENDFDAEILDVRFYGSRVRGDFKDNSDLDAVLYYAGSEREDDMFNLLNDNDDRLRIDGILVDINPIRDEESGTIESYMRRSHQYNKEHLSESRKGFKKVKPKGKHTAGRQASVIHKEGDHWRIMSNKTGSFWPQKYKTRKSALAALKAYQMHH